MWNLQAKVVPRKELLITLEEFRNEYLQVSHQGYSALTWRYEHKPQEPQRWPQERDAKWSAPINLHHTHCAPRQLGTTANWRYDVPRDWLWDACQLARVHWGTHCDRFLSRKACTIALSKVQGTHWNVIRCKECLANCPEAVLGQATINLDARVWKSLEDSLPKQYCIDLAEAYVKRESASSRILCEKKRYDSCFPNRCSHQKPLAKGGKGKENLYWA